MMDHEKFLQELEEIKTGCKVGSRDFSSHLDCSTVCNRLYNSLSECLSVEASRVEAKLKVLTSTLCFYVDLRIRQDAISPEADAFGHFLFMECSRLVLGLQFHHLKNTDPCKASFKTAISDVYTRLHEFAIGQVFVVLEWLMVNQWSHPTLVAMMKGEDIDKERALNFIRSGEYPELFRLRVEMLMQSGCDNFASNLVSWCVQSPLFESDIPLRSTHLLLLQKLGKLTQLQNQCYQMNCCLAREVVKYLEDRLVEDVSSLLSLSHNFLLIDWIKPVNFCCTKNLLETWLKIQRQKEPDLEKFLDSVSKVVGLAQSVKQLNIMLDAMVNIFDTQFIQFCSDLAINSIQKHRQLQQMEDGFHDNSALSSEAVLGLAQVCRTVSKLYQNHPQVHLSSLTSALCLEPTEESYRCLEAAFRVFPSPTCSYDVTSIFPSFLDVNPNTFSLLMENIDSLRPPNIHPQLGWNVLVKLLLPNFESNVDESNLLSGVMDAAEADDVSVNRFNFCDDGLETKEVEIESVSCMLDQESLGYTHDGLVSPSLTQQVLNDDQLDEDVSQDRDIDEDSTDLFERHCQQELLSVDSSFRYHGGNLLSQEVIAPIGVGKNVLNNITLDDIQQVLSGSSLGGSTGKEAPMDEHALQEITAFLQSEMGKNSSILNFDMNTGPIQSNDFLRSSDSPYAINPPKNYPPPPYYSINRSQNCFSAPTTFSQTTPHSSSVLPSLEEPPTNTQATVTSEPTKNLLGTGANILVTDSNLPYLKQFLPHLQTVMQSVQSLVRCSSENEAPARSAVVSAGCSDRLNQYHVVQSSSTCSSFSSSTTFPSSLTSNETQDIYSSTSGSPQSALKEALPDCSSPQELGIISSGVMKQPQSVQQTASTHSSIEGSPRTIPSPFDDMSSKPLLKCDYCSKEFISKAGRTTHILRVHNKKKPAAMMSQSNPETTIITKFVPSPQTKDTNCQRSLSTTPSLELRCSTPKMTENGLSQPATNVAGDSPATGTNNLKHCFVKIVRLDKDSSQQQQQDQQNGLDMTTSFQLGSTLQTGYNSGRSSCESSAQHLKHSSHEPHSTLSPHCMCENCGDLFTSHDQLTTHSCGVVLNVSSSSVHSISNSVQNLDVFDGNSNQMSEERMEEESTTSKNYPGSNYPTSAANQKIVLLVNSNNLQQQNAFNNSNNNMARSNQPKMHAFVRTLKIPGTGSQPTQNILFSTTPTATPIGCNSIVSSSPSSASLLASPKSSSVAPSNSMSQLPLQLQKLFQQHLQLQQQQSSKAIIDKQASFLEMLKLANHFLKSNSMKVTQQQSQNQNNLQNNVALPNAVSPLSKISQHHQQQQEPFQIVSLIHNNSISPQQMNLVSTNQRLLQIINKTNLTIPQLKAALQNEAAMNNNNASNQATALTHSLPAAPLQLHKLNLPGKDVVMEGVHMIEQTEFLCESCLLTFPELDAANQHVSTSDHQLSTVTGYHVYCCPSCGTKYRDKLTVKNHILFTCPHSMKIAVDASTVIKSNNLANTANNAVPDNSPGGDNKTAATMDADGMFSQDHVVKQEPDVFASGCGKSLSLTELMSSPITMISLLKQSSQVQQQLHKCLFCPKIFSSVDFLNLHVSTKHQIAKTEDAEIGDDGQQESTSAMIKKLILKSNMVVSNNSETSNVIPTPSAVSVPTLEQLTLGFKNVSGDGTRITTSTSPLTSVAVHPDTSLSDNKTLISGDVTDISVSLNGQSVSVPSKQNVINLPLVANQKCLTNVTALQSVSQIPALVPHPPKTSKAKGILYKNVYMQCEGTYYCSVCKADLSSRESKRSHRQMACGDPKTVTYSRKYFYLCPYCSEKFPSQKECRHHQVTECLPMIGVSTDELTVKELACPLCPKKYHNLIPLKGHMTQVHHMPKSETRKILEGLGYLETAFDQHILPNPNGSAVTSSNFGIFTKTLKPIKQDVDDTTNGPQMTLPVTSPVVSLASSSNNLNFPSSCSSIDLFDLDPDMSSDINSADVNCETVYAKDALVFSPDDEEDQSKKDSCFDDYDMNSTLLNMEGSMTSTSFVNDVDETSRKLQTPTQLSSASFDESPSSWSSPSPNVPSSFHIPSSSNPSFNSRMDEQRPLSSSSSTADSTLSPEQKRRRTSSSNKPAEFFIMMFRNYPVLAKGVFVCSGCRAQMTCSGEAERHQAECTAQKNGKPVEIRRSTLFRCTHCPTTFWRAKLCREHQLQYCLAGAGNRGESVDLESLTLPSVACPLCSARSYNRSGLMSHMKYKHAMDTKGVREIMEKCGIRKQTPERFGASNSFGTTSVTSDLTTLTATVSTLPDVVSVSVAASSVVSMDSSQVTAITNSIITNSPEAFHHGKPVDEEDDDDDDDDLDLTNDNFQAGSSQFQNDVLMERTLQPSSAITRSISTTPSFSLKSNDAVKSVDCLFVPKLSTNKRKFGNIIGSVLRNSSRKEKLTVTIKSSKRPASSMDVGRAKSAAVNSSPCISDSSSCDDLHNSSSSTSAKKKAPLPEEQLPSTTGAVAQSSMVC